jgi:hypothetical protein
MEEITWSKQASLLCGFVQRKIVGNDERYPHNTTALTFSLHVRPTICRHLARGVGLPKAVLNPYTPYNPYLS